MPSGLRRLWPHGWCNCCHHLRHCLVLLPAAAASSCLSSVLHGCLLFFALRQRQAHSRIAMNSMSRCCFACSEQFALAIASAADDIFIDFAALRTSCLGRRKPAPPALMLGAELRSSRVHQSAAILRVFQYSRCRRLHLFVSWLLCCEFAVGSLVLLTASLIQNVDLWTRRSCCILVDPMMMAETLKSETRPIGVNVLVAGLLPSAPFWLGRRLYYTCCLIKKSLYEVESGRCLKHLKFRKFVRLCFWNSVEMKLNTSYLNSGMSGDCFVSSGDIRQPCLACSICACFPGCFYLSHNTAGYTYYCRCNRHHSWQ